MKVVRLLAASSIHIERHTKIRAEANPYDPAWEPYLEERMTWKMGHTLAGRTRIGYLWKEQGGRCVACKQVLRVEEQPMHIHHRRWRCFGGLETFDNLELLHANCHRQIHARKTS